MFSRACRLAKEKDIEKVFKHGRSASSPNLFLRFCPNHSPKTRITVVAGLKVHKKAVKRNLVKRRLREILRLNYTKITPGFDLVLVAKAGTVGKKYKELEQETRWLLQKSRIFG